MLGTDKQPRSVWRKCVRYSLIGRGICGARNARRFSLYRHFFMVLPSAFLCLESLILRGKGPMIRGTGRKCIQFFFVFSSPFLCFSWKYEGERFVRYIGIFTIPLFDNS